MNFGHKKEDLMKITLPDGSQLYSIGDEYFIDGAKVDAYEAEQIINALTGDEDEDR